VWKVFFKSHIVVAPTFRKVQTFIAPEPPKVDPAKEA